MGKLNFVKINAQVIECEGRKTERMHSSYSTINRGEHSTVPMSLSAYDVEENAGARVALRECSNLFLTYHFSGSRSRSIWRVSQAAEVGHSLSAD